MQQPDAGTRHSRPNILRYLHQISSTEVEIVTGTKIGTQGATVAVARQGIAFDDPAGPDFVLQKTIRMPSTIEVDLGAGKFRMSGGTTVSPPGLDCAYDGEGPIELSYVGIPPALLTRHFEDLGVRLSDLGPLHAGSFIDPLVDRITNEMLAEVKGNRAHGSLYGDHLVLALGRALLRRSRYLTLAPGPMSALSAVSLSRVVEYVRAHIAEELELEQLAALAGMGTYEFSRAFKVAMGQTPWQFVISLRCEHAADLIARHGRTASLAFVAGVCGFHDQSHLNRHFKRHIGTTPGAYRRSLA
ncbi:MAG: AraC family transcriptional regulator [Myxococcota bacterium]